MEQKQRLGRDVFIALAAIGWADGQLDPDEADAIVRTALEEGLDLVEIEEIERATKEPVELAAVDLVAAKMSKEDRLFVYGVASWITRLDGLIDERETEALEKLGQSLQIAEQPRRAVDHIAEDIALLPEGDRPARYDLPRLRREIQERLARSAQKKGG